MTEPTYRIDAERIQAEAERLRRIYADAPAKAAENPVPSTPGELAARAIARGREAR